MIPKLIFALVWFHVFSIGSAFILGFLWRLSGLEISGVNKNMVVLIISMIIGLLGFALGIMGKLPGTKLPPKPE